MGFVRRLPRISLVAAMVTTLITGVLSGAAVSAAEATIYPSSRWDASAFTHDPGYPTTSATPGLTVVQASLAVVAGAPEMSGSFTLSAVPDSSAVVQVGPSYLNEDGTCASPFLYRARVPAAGGPGITWSGSTASFTLPLPEGGISPNSPVDCASVEVFQQVTDEFDDTSAFPVDKLSAPLTPTPVYPTPLLSAPDPLKLVRGVPTPFYVTVTNPADSSAPPPGWTTVSGTGTGVTVKSEDTPPDDLPPGSSATVRLMVTLTAKKAPAQITLTATPPEFTFSTTIATKAIKPPNPPKAGRYRGNGITFRVVAKGKKRWVTQIVGRPKDNCIDDPIDPPQRYRVPANNIIDTYSKDDILATFLVYNRVIMHFSGKRVTGYLDESYFDTSCVMGLNFKAKRVGP